MYFLFWSNLLSALLIYVIRKSEQKDVGRGLKCFNWNGSCFLELYYASVITCDIVFWSWYVRLTCISFVVLFFFLGFLVLGPISISRQICSPCKKTVPGGKVGAVLKLQREREVSPDLCLHQQLLCDWLEIEENEISQISSLTLKSEPNIFYHSCSA